jgi:hypothetical protein
MGSGRFRATTMSAIGMIDVTKLHFVGNVDYAAHNFARLKPLLFSESGTVWDGPARREWFPTSGLVFSVAVVLRYAPSGSLWLFRVKSNTRAESVGKDRFSAIQLRPAIRLRTDMNPDDPESLRRLATQTGLETTYGGQGAALPESEDQWVIVPSFRKDNDDRWRPPSDPPLRDLKVVEGTAEELCGHATADGTYVLPPKVPPSVGSRNWLEPRKLFEQLASDLRRWIPFGPQKARAQVAAQALRDLAPHLDTLTSLKAEDARTALSRARGLLDDAVTLTTAPDEILAILTETEPFKSAVERERERIRVTLEELALSTVETLEADLRARLVKDRQRLTAEVDEASITLESLRKEIVAAKTDVATAKSQQAENVEELDRRVHELLARAASEPGRTLADWLGVSGFVVSATHTVPEPVNQPLILNGPALTAPLTPLMDGAGLGPALFDASPAERENGIDLLVIDAAIRARELPLLIGPFAREFAEAWLGVAGGIDPIALVTDPTLLSLRELTPSGPRGAAAPLAAAFARAHADPSRLTIVVLDDMDPAAAAFWLPELARALRCPSRYGFPPNLLALAILEADPAQMRLTPTRAAELFPMTFEGCSPRSRSKPPCVTVRELTLELVAPARVTTVSAERLASFRAAAAATFSTEEAGRLALQLDLYLAAMKASKVNAPDKSSLCARLLSAAHLITTISDRNSDA